MIWKAYLSFLVLLGGGLIKGIVISFILNFILVRVRHSFQVSSSLMLQMPFVTYHLAKELHVSGVIAVVTLGLSLVRFSPLAFPEK